jgi:hypothetical protein
MFGGKQKEVMFSIVNHLNLEHHSVSCCGSYGSHLQPTTAEITVWSPSMWLQICKDIMILGFVHRMECFIDNKKVYTFHASYNNKIRKHLINITATSY